MEKIFFREEQHFGRWWLWLILLTATVGSTLPFIYGIYSQEVLGIPWGNHPTNTTVLIAILVVDSLVVGSLCFLIAKMKLIVEIRKDGIWYKYPPLYSKWRNIKKEEIERFEIRKYNPVTEYGGWGIKGRRKNRVLNTSGNIGLQLYLKDGSKLLLGTFQKQAIEYATEKMMNKENSV